MQALIKYQAQRGLLYKILKGGTIVALLGTVTSALNHDHLVLLFGDKWAAGITMCFALLSAISPSVTGMLADALYPETSVKTPEVQEVLVAKQQEVADAKVQQ